MYYNKNKKDKKGEIFVDGRDLYKIAREFLDKEFNMTLDIPIFINSKMKTMYGCFRYKKGQAWQIDISKEFMETQTEEVIIDVLKHELVHYALFQKGLPHSDKDKYFKDTVDRLGIARTRTYKNLGKFHKYGCNCEGNFFYRKRKLSKNSYCDECGALYYIGIVEKSH